MLIRFAVTNFLSFRDRTEFNMLTADVPNPPHTTCSICGIELVKIAAIFGHRNKGKSDLIRALKYVRRLMFGYVVLKSLIKHRANKDEPSVFEIEFIADGRPYYCRITLIEKQVLKYELAISYLGKSDDEPILEPNCMDYVIQLAPLLWDEVAIIDKIEYINYIIKHRDKLRGQIIFKTNDLNYLNSPFFRRDEIWFAKKNAIGATELRPLSDYKISEDLDIKKGYINGRFG